MCLCSSVDLRFLLVNIWLGPASHEEEIPSNIVMNGLRCLQAVGGGEMPPKQHMLEYQKTQAGNFHSEAVKCVVSVMVCDCVCEEEKEKEKESQ